MLNRGSVVEIRAQPRRRPRRNVATPDYAPTSEDEEEGAGKKAFVDLTQRVKARRNRYIKYRHDTESCTTQLHAILWAVLFRSYRAEARSNWRDKRDLTH